MTNEEKLLDAMMVGDEHVVALARSYAQSAIAHDGGNTTLYRILARGAETHAERMGYLRKGAEIAMAGRSELPFLTLDDERRHLMIYDLAMALGRDGSPESLREAIGLGAMLMASDMRDKRGMRYWIAAWCAVLGEWGRGAPAAALCTLDRSAESYVLAAIYAANGVCSLGDEAEWIEKAVDRDLRLVGLMLAAEPAPFEGRSVIVGQVSESREAAARIWRAWNESRDMLDPVARRAMAEMRSAA